MSKRDREPLRVLMVMDSSTYNGQVLQRCMDSHSQQAAVEYCVANDPAELSSEAAAGIHVVLHAVFAGGKAGTIKEIWPALSSVKWVHSLSTGVDGLVPVLRECPGAEAIPVTNAKGAFNRSLAEWCLTAFLHFNKQIPRVVANRKARVWDKFIMGELAELTVGFVGFGSIAQSTAALCRAFGMKVIALRRRAEGPGSELADRVYTFAEGKQAFMAQCDFAVCSLPATPETYHWCDAEAFGALKQTAVFVSIGRGTCVDEAALVEALQGDKIRGAALDVFEKEPLCPESGLWDCDNLLLTAHNADNTESYMDDAWKVYLQNLELFERQAQMETIDLVAGY